MQNTFKDTLGFFVNWSFLRLIISQLASFSVIAGYALLPITRTMVDITALGMLYLIFAYGIWKDKSIYSALLIGATLNALVTITSEYHTFSEIAFNASALIVGIMIGLFIWGFVTVGITRLGYHLEKTLKATNEINTR